MQVRPSSNDSAVICDTEFQELELGGEWRQLLLGVVVVSATAFAAWWWVLPGAV